PSKFFFDLNIALSVFFHGHLQNITIYLHVMHIKWESNNVYFIIVKTFMIQPFYMLDDCQAILFSLDNKIFFVVYALFISECFSMVYISVGFISSLPPKYIQF